MKSVTKLATSLGAFALALGLSGAGLAAFADNLAAVPESDTVNAGHAVSLTIQKFAGQPTGDPALSGTSPSGTAPKAGETFTFTITPIKVNGNDLSLQPSDPTFWTKLQALTANGYPADSALDASKTITMTLNDTSSPKWAGCVNSDGKEASGLQQPTALATCKQETNLAQGAYVVKETSAPDGYQTANPFVITLPTYNPGTHTWDYSPVVYPKNQKVTLGKDLTDISYDTTDGQVYTYAIHTDLPASGWSPYNEKKPFRILDHYPAGYEYKADSVTVSVYDSEANRLKGTANTTNQFAATTDFTVDNSNNLLTITFTKDGQKKIGDLRKDNPSLVVQASLKFKVASVAGDGANSVNLGGVIFPGSDKTPTPDDNHPIPGDQTTHNQAPLLNVTIVKKDLKDGAPGDNTLPGAHFSFFKCKYDDGTGKYATDGGALAAYGENGSTLTTDFVTGSEGQVVANNVPDVSKMPVAGTSPVSYYHLCLVETQAPKDKDGVKYVKYAEPMPVQVSNTAPKFKDDAAPTAFTNKFAAGTATVIEDGTNKVKTPGTPSTDTITVGNAQDTIFGQLPSTGAAGVGGLLAAGAGFLIIGAVLRRRRSKEQA